MQLGAVYFSCTLLALAACERTGPSQATDQREEINADAASPEPMNPAASIAPTPVADVRAQLEDATRRYFGSADESVHMEIIAEIAELAEAEEHRADVARTLGALFIGTNAADTKIEILDDLIEIKDPAAFFQVVTGLDKTQPKEVRLATIAALQFLEDKRALAPLQAMANDADADIREGVQDALEGLQEAAPE